MFKRRTLFIVGAGGSKEVGLPIADELRSEISALMDIRFSHRGEMNGVGDRRIYDILRHSFQQDINAYLHACWNIRDGIALANSIDSFIDNHLDDQKIQLCGKIAIVRSIIEAERNSNLFFDPLTSSRERSIKFEDIQDKYFIKLWRILHSGVRKTNLETLFNNIAFIVFNYDRCLEHFFYHAIQKYYSIPEADAISIISTMRIIHPYGTVGVLPWCGQREAVPFGGEDPRYGSIDLRRLSDGIKTYTEQLEDAAEIHGMHAQIDAAEDVVFLGFGYLPENMQLLTPRLGCEPRPRRVFGTVYGLSTSATGVVNERIRELYPKCKEPRIANLTCGQLFQEYGLELTQ